MSIVNLIVDIKEAIAESAIASFVSAAAASLMKMPASSVKATSIKEIPKLRKIICREYTN